MAEWSMAVVLKTTVPETVPGVRIPLPPPSFALGRRRPLKLLLPRNLHETSVEISNRSASQQLHRAMESGDQDVHRLSDSAFAASCETVRVRAADEHGAGADGQR